MRAGIRFVPAGCPRLLLVAAIAVVLAAPAAGCRGKNADHTHDGAAMTEPTIQSVLEKESPALMALPGVVAVGEGRTKDGKPCVRIYVDGLTEERRGRFPKSLGPYAVELEDSGGPIRAMPDSGAGS